MMTLFTNPSECCGCEACKNICQKNAISMQTDEKGFAYPAIDEAACVSCGACQKVCPLKGDRQKPVSQKTYAVKHKVSAERKSSSSGGAFIEMARHIIRNNGAVYGAAYGKNFQVSHVRAVSEAALEQLKTSKYLQSRIGDVYRQVKDDLKNGMPVLFSGTGCQVQGLRSYLGRDYPQLYCVDIVCHGVPSQKLFDDYIQYLEDKYKSKAKSVNFRGKQIKNVVQDMLVTFENGKTYSCAATFDSYYMFFIKNFSLRESCYTCRFSNSERGGDITLADFWKLENQFPEFQDFKGVSLVITNNDRGEQLFAALKDKFDIIETPKETAFAQQPLQKPFAKPPKSDLFWNTYLHQGYKACVKKYHSFPKLKHFVRKHLR